MDFGAAPVDLEELRRILPLKQGEAVVVNLVGFLCLELKLKPSICILNNEWTVYPACRAHGCKVEFDR